MVSSDDDAVMGQPIYLMVAVIIASVIVASILFGLYDVTSKSQNHIVNHEIDKILVKSAMMYEYADEAALVTVDVEFPASMRFIVFGGVPQETLTQPPHNLSLNESVSNNYYYVMDDGTVHMGHSNARFSAQNTSQIAVFQPGSYTLRLELYSIEGRTYVKVY